jgi:hypothetical protein
MFIAGFRYGTNYILMMVVQTTPICFHLDILKSSCSSGKIYIILHRRDLKNSIKFSSPFISEELIMRDDVIEMPKSQSLWPLDDGCSTGFFG